MIFVFRFDILRNEFLNVLDFFFGYEEYLDGLVFGLNFVDN